MFLYLWTMVLKDNILTPMDNVPMVAFKTVSLRSVLGQCPSNY